MLLFVVFLLVSPKHGLYLESCWHHTHLNWCTILQRDHKESQIEKVRRAEMKSPMCLSSRHSVNYGSKLIAAVFCFAELVRTCLWAVWTEYHALGFLPRPAKRKSNVSKLESSQDLTVVVYVLCIQAIMMKISASFIVFVILNVDSRTILFGM